MISLIGSPVILPPVLDPSETFLSVEALEDAAKKEAAGSKEK